MENIEFDKNDYFNFQEFQEYFAAKYNIDKVQIIAKKLSNYVILNNKIMYLFNKETVLYRYFESNNYDENIACDKIGRAHV